MVVNFSYVIILPCNAVLAHNKMSLVNKLCNDYMLQPLVGKQLTPLRKKESRTYYNRISKGRVLKQYIKFTCVCFSFISKLFVASFNDITFLIVKYKKRTSKNKWIEKINYCRLNNAIWKTRKIELNAGAQGLQQ